MVQHEKPSGERQPRRRRWRRWLGGAALVGVLLLALAYGLRDAWLGPLAVRSLERYAHEQLGAELTVERAHGSWLHGVVLEGVRWRAQQSPLLALEQARVELGWSLRGVLRGEPGLSVRVTGRGVDLATLPAGQDASADAERGRGAPLGDLARLELELDLTDVRLHQPGTESLRLARVRGRGGLVGLQAHVDALELVAGASRITLADAALDLAAGDGLAIARSLRGELTADVRIEAAEADLLARLAGRPLPLRSAALTLSVEDGHARVAGSAELEGGTLVVEHGEVVWPAGAPLTELELALRLRADFHALDALAPLVGQSLAGRWRGSIDVEGPLRAPTGRFVGHGEELVLAGVVLGAFDVDVHTDGERVRFERCEISGPELEAVLRGEVQLDPLELDDVALNVSADRGALAQLLPVPCEHAFLHARLDGPPRAPRGAFELSATGTSVGPLRIDDAEARGTLDGTRFEFSELRLTSGESFVEAAGTLARENAGWSAELAHLAVVWRGSRAEIEPGARLAFGSGRLAVDGLVLTSAGAGAPGHASVALRHEDGQTRAALVFAGYDAGPLLAPFLPAGVAAGRVAGSVEGTLGVAGSGAVPALELDLAFAGWQAGPGWPALEGVLRGAFDGSELALERVELGYEGEEGARLAGTLRVPLTLDALQPFAPGRVELELEGQSGDAVRSLRRAGLVGANLAGLSHTGPCRIGLELAGEWRALSGRLTLAAAQVTFGRLASARACDLEAELAFGERIEIERALFSAPSGSITLAGALGTAFDPAGWSADPWVLYEAPLALTAKLDLADIGWIAGLTTDLRRISGQLAGRLGIGGNLLEPALTGALELREGELRLASGAPPVRALEAELTFDDQVVRIERLTGEIGGAEVRVSGTVEPFGPFPRLDLVAAGENLLLVRNAHLRLRADADLLVKGTPSLLTIRGELALAEGLYTGEISPLEELLRVGRRGQPARSTQFELWSEGPLASAELDLHLGGRRTFDYRTNLLSASLRPDAWLRGTGAFPVLEGPVYVEEASLTLPSGELELVSGVLNFRREAPLRPEIAVTAEMRVQRHDVRAVATGVIGEREELEIVLSSTPPLPSDDLWILVLTGQLPQSRWQDRSTQAMEALAVFLARDTLVRWFGSEPDDNESLLERFEIDLGAETSRSGQPTGRVLFYLKPQERRSGRATYLSAELDEYDRVNYALGIVFRPR